MPSFLLSDFVFPIANMPQLLQKLSLLIPATYFMDILNGLYLRDLGFQDMWSSYLVLFVMFLFLSIINVMKLKREGL
jgi:ABC-2 type transport system permease protein